MPCVLILEDDFLIAMDLHCVLQTAGCSVLGPVPSEAAALDLIESVRPDVALVDINLGNGACFGVADRLAELNVPFAFLTGHGQGVIPSRHAGRPIHTKPYEPRQLVHDVLALAGADALTSMHVVSEQNVSL